MLYYSHFVIASSVTTFRFLTDLQLLYLDAFDNFLNHGSLDRGPVGQDLVDRGLRNPEPLDLGPRGLEPLDLEPIGLEPIGPEPLDHGSIDHRPAPLPVAVDQDNFAAAVMATTVIPVMSEPRLALIDGGKSDSLDGRNSAGEWDTIQSGRTNAPASDGPDEQDGREQTGQETAGRENGWINKTAATVVAVAAGAALLETALLPGLALGVAAIAAPKYVSRLARAITPMFKSTVRATYKLAKKPGEAFAEAQHQINGIIAEVRAEDASHAGMRAAEELRAAA
jgi:hypothetical protein